MSFLSKIQKFFENVDFPVVVKNLFLCSLNLILVSFCPPYVKFSSHLKSEIGYIFFLCTPCSSYLEDAFLHFGVHIVIKTIKGIHCVHELAI